MKQINIDFLVRKLAEKYAVIPSWEDYCKHISSFQPKIEGKEAQEQWLKFFAAQKEYFDNMRELSIQREEMEIRKVVESSLTEVVQT